MEYIETPDSSNLSKFGFDKTQSVLSVQFKSGDIYDYKGVSEKVFDNMVTAKSRGKFFHKYIKGKYMWTKK